MADYAEQMKDVIYSPREYIEHQLNMTDEEKEQRQRFFEDLFANHNKKKGNAV